eukprot:106081-Chlamydomonas_euryale.AAC.3
MSVVANTCRCKRLESQTQTRCRRRSVPNTCLLHAARCACDATSALQPTVGHAARRSFPRQTAAAARGSVHRAKARQKLCGLPPSVPHARVKLPEVPDATRVVPAAAREPGAVGAECNVRHVRRVAPHRCLAAPSVATADKEAHGLQGRRGGEAVGQRVGAMNARASLFLFA